MDWNDVRLLLVVAREGSLARAAKKLSLDHSTLSRRISAFERSLGAPLFLRSADGMRPSPRGEAVLEEARRVEKAVEGFATASARLAEDQSRGPVRLASSGILAELLVPHFVELRKSAPDVELEWLLARRLVDLSRHEADIALRLRPRGSKIAEPSIMATRLGKVKWGLYGARRMKRADEWLIRYLDTSIEPGAVWLAKHRQNVRTATRVDYVPAALALVREGAGAAVLPYFLGDVDPVLRCIDRDVDEHYLFAAVHADMRRVARVDLVLGWLRTAVTLEKARLVGASTKA